MLWANEVGSTELRGSISREMEPNLVLEAPSGGVAPLSSFVELHKNITLPRKHMPFRGGLEYHWKYMVDLPHIRWQQ
jgi:hypothetical protein